MFDFDELIDRRQTSSMKWGQMPQLLTPGQCAAEPLPMWVADMDFRAAPAILDALHAHVQQGVLGYGGSPESCLEAVAGWQRRRFGWHVEPDWITQTPGVVNALNTCVQAFSQPGDFVLVQTPVYLHIHHDVVLNGRRLLTAPLGFEGGRYRFDAEAFEAAILPGTRIFILCHPHNPTGNVWSRDDLLAMATICERHGVLVVSDEIHQDFVFGGGKRHIPLASLGERIAANAVVCTAPSKTFNLAGLSCANIVIPDAGLRRAFRAQCARNGTTLMNTMGPVACEAAYRHGESWADAMLDYIRSNQAHLAGALSHLPVRVTPADSLYLAWLDFRELGMAPDRLHDFLLRKARLWLDPGTKFGPGGEGFMRINLGCPRLRVDDAIGRLSEALR